MPERQRPKPTGVAKYLSTLPTVEETPKPKETPVGSGVARYLAAQPEAGGNKTGLSGVAKYLEKQTQLEHKAMPSLPHHSGLQAEALEGEFIPANTFAPTGVSRYLERQGTVVNTVAAGTAGSATGVSRYLNKIAGSTTSQSKTSATTGVDRYLVNRAA